VFLAAGLLACSHAVELRPAPGSQQVSGQAATAVADANGVRISAAGKWLGSPDELWKNVTPVRVIVENHSGAPVRIRYNDFTLTSSAGVVSYAMPPFQVERPVAIKPHFPVTGFSVAAPFAAFYPGYPLWPGPFDYDPAFFSSGYQWPASLPSADMLAKTIPIGVLADGGSASGYLYFPKLPNNVHAVTFTATLVDATTLTQAAQVSIPFVVFVDGPS
jgi:hypothetical protein